MNTLTKYLRFVTGFSMLVAGLTLPSSAQAQPSKTPSKTPERIGVYDSRAIAVVFAGSAERKQELVQLRAERDQAKAAGDHDKAARLEAEEKERKAKVQRQAFSTEPVDEILQHITNALPQIKKDADVTVLISKWDEAELKKHPRAKQIDVTVQLIDAFNPNADQRKAAMKILNYKPISPEKAAKMKD